jgi:hypothetical protein
MVRFIALINDTDFNPRMERTAQLQFSLGEVWVNPEYVVSVREATGYKTLLQEGRLPAGLEDNHTFTTLVMSRGNVTETHVVVGSPKVVAVRLKNQEKQLLKG